MQTRAKSNIHKPLKKLDLHTTLSQHSDLEPTTSAQALKAPKWHQAMSDEFNALIRNSTWQLIPASSNQNVVACKWIFRTKRHSNGSIDKYKARLVAKGFHQRPDVDYYDTFSPVIKPTTIRLVLSIAISSEWTLRQLDVNNCNNLKTISINIYLFNSYIKGKWSNFFFFVKFTKISNEISAESPLYREIPSYRQFILHTIIITSHP
jgi:histone deacetylase 1/2